MLPCPCVSVVGRDGVLVVAQEKDPTKRSALLAGIFLPPPLTVTHGAKEEVRSSQQYFDAIRTGKMDTLRWCLRHGGISVRAENDDGETGIQIAAANGYSEAMQTLIENVRKVGQPADLEETDDEGRTPLMLAALNGKLECARLLVVEGKVKLATKCDHGKTARMYAESRKHDKVVAFLDNPKAPIEESQDEESEDEEEKQKRIFKARSAPQTSRRQRHSRRRCISSVSRRPRRWRRLCVVGAARVARGCTHPQGDSP